MGRQSVSVEFLSRDIQKYGEHCLMLGIPLVGEAVHSIPIRAECVVPMVALSAEFLNFEHCYLRSGDAGLQASLLACCIP